VFHNATTHLRCETNRALFLAAAAAAAAAAMQLLKFDPILAGEGKEGEGREMRETEMSKEDAEEQIKCFF
jgi:hypothetical protein